MSEQGFTQHSGIAAPLDQANVDTDQIIPKQFLTGVTRAGYGKHLFHDWRYLDLEEKEPNPEFSLNKPEHKGASILLARENFGCGSSREHAPWALADFGIKVVVSTSFADIFFNNCFKNGMLPIVLPQEQVDLLMSDAEKGENARMTVDLEAQEITTSEGEVIKFDVDPFRKHCLLNGLDDIGLTLEKADAIKSYEERVAQERPWV